MELIAEGGRVYVLSVYFRTPAITYSVSTLESEQKKIMLRLAHRGCSSRVLSSWLQRPQCQAWTRTLATHTQQSTLDASCSDDFGPLTDIEKIMVNSVKATGPFSFATYMQLCLSHPIHGYYMNPQHAVFGTRGDFTTSPEISQVFGEVHWRS